MVKRANPWGMCSYVVVLLWWSTPGAMGEGVPRAKAVVQKLQKEPLADVLKYPLVTQNRVHMKVLSEYFATVLEAKKQIGEEVHQGEVILVLRRSEFAWEFKPILVRSPIHGVVQSTFVLPGEQVPQGHGLMHLVDPSQLLLEIEVPQKQLMFLSKGTLGHITLDAPVGGGPAENTLGGVHAKPPGSLSAPVEILGIGPLSDPITGTSTVRLDWHFPGGAKEAKAFVAQHHIKAGITARIVFRVHERLGLALPDRGVQYEGDQAVVRTVDAGKKVHKVPVALGRPLEGHRVEILAPHLEGQFVITQVNRLTKEGEEVEVEGL